MIYLAAVLAFVLSLGGTGFYGFIQGKKVERAEWLERDAEQREKMAKELAAAMERVTKQNQQNLNNTMKVINEKNEAIANLERDLDNAGRVRIVTKKPDCPSNTMPRKTEGASERILPISERGAGIVGAIPNEIQSDDNTLNEQLRKVYINQERLKIDLKRNIGLCEPLVEIAK